jgi:membrane-associated protease RseP (regulator of RpoE activity)
MRRPAHLNRGVRWLLLFGLLILASSVSAEGRGVLGMQMDYSVSPAGHGRIQVISVRTGSAAEKGGLQPGDIIVRVGGKTLPYSSSLELYRADLFRAGAKVELAIERAGRQLALTVTPDRAGEQVRQVESFVAELERCGGDVACATGCAETAERRSVPRIDSAFVKGLESQPVRLTLHAGRLGNDPTLEMTSTRLDYRNDVFLADLVGELGPLLAKTERIEFELRRSPAGIGMKILHPDSSQLQPGGWP